MKKILAVFLCVMLTLSVVTPALASNNIKVNLDGRQLNFDVPPMEIDGRVMVPVRVIFEALGASVEWVEEAQAVNAQKDGTYITLFLDNTTMYVNGKEKKLDVPAKEIGGRTLVPVRAISEAFGTSVDWDDSEQTVILKNDGKGIKEEVEETKEVKKVDPVKISLNKSDTTILVGYTSTLKYTISPAEAADDIVVWRSTQPTIATVEDGVVTGIKAGTAKIVAETSNGLKATCNVTVKYKPQEAHVSDDDDDYYYYSPTYNNTTNSSSSSSSNNVYYGTTVLEFSGYGDKVIENVKIPAGPYYTVASHQGSRNFISKLYYGDSYFLLTNEIGTCSNVIESLYRNANAAINDGRLEVKADGSWTIKIKPVTGSTTTNIKGRGDVVTGVFTAKSSKPVIKLTHSGDRNFIVKIIKYHATRSYDYELVANEIGNYNGQDIADLDVGEKYYIYVQADGNWTIDFGEGDGLTTYTSSGSSTTSNSTSSNSTSSNSTSNNTSYKDTGSNNTTVTESNGAKQLVNYILQRGKQKGICYYIATTDVRNGYNYNTEIRYIPSTGNLEFIQFLTKDKLSTHVSFTFDPETRKVKNNTINGNYLDTRYGTVATAKDSFVASSVSINTDFNFTEVGIPMNTTDAVYGILNSLAGVAVINWRTLMNSTGISLSSIGFPSL